MPGVISGIGFSVLHVTIFQKKLNGCKSLTKSLFEIRPTPPKQQLFS